MEKHILLERRGVAVTAQMDAVDFQILVGLLSDPTASYEALGREVDLSGTSVKNRLGRMYEQGPLRGFVGLPHAEVFGRESRIYWGTPGEQGRDRLAGALEVDPVVWVNLLHTGEVAVHLYEEPGGSLPDRVGEILGTELEMSGGISRPGGKPGEAVLSSLDWRLVRHLVREPTLSVREFVDRTGLSRNTVSKRRSRLFDEQFVSLFPLLEQARTPNLVLYSVVVHVGEPAARSRVQSVLPNAVPVAHGVGESKTVATTFMGHAATLAEVSTGYEEVESMDGVQEARLIIDLERLVAVDRLEGWVEEELTRWEQAGST